MYVRPNFIYQKLNFIPHMLLSQAPVIEVFIQMLYILPIISVGMNHPVMFKPM